MFGPGLTAASVALAIAYVPYVARVLRAAALQRAQPALRRRARGAGRFRPGICVRHIVPNVASLIVAQATIAFGYALLDLAAISFLGLGVQPPTPNWGVMVSENAVGIMQGNPRSRSRRASRS